MAMWLAPLNPLFITRMGAITPKEKSLTKSGLVTGHSLRMWWQRQGVEQTVFKYFCHFIILDKNTKATTIYTVCKMSN